jgi:chemotaxis signal transduction protein
VALAAGQRVAVPLEQAREIVHARQVTRLPGAVPWVAGLFNLRGTVLTVLDLAVRLGGAPSVGPVIVVEVEERSVGLRVDGVEAVVTAEGEEQAVAAARSADGGVRGAVMTHDGEALVLDVATLQRTALAEA